MDEPLSNLDAKLRLEMRTEIRRIHDAIGSTTVYVTHDQDEALSMADRIVVLRDGVVRQTGTPAELYERPLHPDVAAFMGFRNHIVGRVASVTGERAEIEVAGGRLTGLVREPVTPGAGAVVAIRPEDLVAGEASGLPAKVSAVEYRGRAFFGTASGPDGSELFFRSDRPVARDEIVQLSAVPDRTLVFAAT